MHDILSYTCIAKTLYLKLKICSTSFIGMSTSEIGATITLRRNLLLFLFSISACGNKVVTRIENQVMRKGNDLD